MEEEFMLSKMSMEIQLVLSVVGFQIKVHFSFILDVQGLAMSRSIGDNISKSIGVIHHP